MTSSTPPAASTSHPLLQRLFDPIDNASIVWFRIAFGVLALWEVWRYANYGWIDRYYIAPSFHFTFYGFHWVQPWAGDGMYWHFGLLGVLALCIIFGLFYRGAAALFFVAFTYVFLLEKAKYLNHLYLFSLLSFLMIFIPAHRDLSLDARLRPAIRSQTAPAWTLWLLRLQMGVVYFYAGVAKINWDWLQGWPLRIWLPRESSFPLIGRFFVEEWCQLLFSYGGLLLDLLGPFLLLWRRTRVVTFAFFVFFHLTNSRLFGIGIFPWLSIAATLLFFASNWPRRLFNWPRTGPPPERELAAPTRLATGQRLAVAALAVFVAVQLLVPLRPFLYPGNVSWTEEGHNFSWHQKLRDKDGRARFNVTVPSSGETFEVDPREYLTSRQYRKMETRPHMVLEFAHHLAGRFGAQYGERVEVRADVTVSLNGRPEQRLIDPAVDLAKERRGIWHKPWILPLTTPLQ
jgi:vitamin K-dependent gamma-carboxylase